MIGVNYEHCNNLDHIRLSSVGNVYSSRQTTCPYSTVMGLMTTSLALLIAIGYGLIAYVLIGDINKARKVWDIATLGSKL